MSLDVLCITLRRWQRWQSLATIAKPYQAEFGLRVKWGQAHCALVAREQTPNFWPLISSRKHTLPGILVVPFPDRDLVAVIVWTETGIELWRCIHRGALAPTLRIVESSMKHHIRYGFCPQGFERCVLEACLPSTQWESLDFQWDDLNTLPVLQRTPKLSAAVVASLAFFAVAWVWPELSNEEAPSTNPAQHIVELRENTPSQTRPEDPHVRDALAHHTIVSNALIELPGWAPVNFRWDRKGILVQVRADTGDLLDLHEFAMGQGIQIQHEEGGRALYWATDKPSSHVVTPTLPFAAQGDWLEDLIHRQFPGLALQRQRVTEHSGLEQRGRFRLRFDDFSFYDFDRLADLLAAHPVVLRALEYEVTRPHAFPWVGRGEMTFEYVGD